MSTPTYTWSDVINNFIEAARSVLYQIGSFIVENAQVIVEAVMGIGLAYTIYRYASRAVPWIRSIFGRLI